MRITSRLKNILVEKLSYNSIGFIRASDVTLHNLLQSPSDLKRSSHKEIYRVGREYHSIGLAIDGRMISYLHF